MIKYKNEQELMYELVHKKRIDKKTISKNIFREREYTSLVSPYKRLICLNYDTTRKEYIYKSNGDFKEYINYARIDDFLSAKVSLYIECFEKRFKSYVAEKVVEKMNEYQIFCNDYTLLEDFFKKLILKDLII